MNVMCLLKHSSLTDRIHVYMLVSGHEKLFFFLANVGLSVMRTVIYAVLGTTLAVTLMFGHGRNNGSSRG